MDRKILGVGPRTAAFLRQKYPRHAAKRIAQDFHVSLGTSERWLRGEAPTVRHIEQMVGTFGESYIRMVFAEAFEQQDQRIRELESLNISLYKVSAIAGGVVGGAAIGFLSMPIVQLISNSRRIFLIEGLIDTVPTE